jgi:DNA-binding NtrC family response regulator
MTKILIVDDDGPVCNTVSALLEALGHEVRTATSGKVVLREIEAFEPEIVLLDLLMPEKDGIETLREVKHTRPDLPVIMMTGGGVGWATTLLEMTRRLGATQVLQKPFTKNRLSSVIADAAAGPRASRSAETASSRFKATVRSGGVVDFRLARLSS